MGGGECQFGGGVSGCNSNDSGGTADGQVANHCFLHFWDSKSHDTKSHDKSHDWEACKTFQTINSQSYFINLLKL